MTILGGPTETFFSRPDVSRRDCARVPLTLASLLLFHRGFDGRMAMRRGYAPVKTACESEQRHERERYHRLKKSDSVLTRETAGVKTGLFSRATASSEPCTMIDTVWMQARTPPRSPIRARATKCLLGDDAWERIVTGACVPTATRKSHGRANTLIDLVLSSSIDGTVKVFTESFVLS